MNQSMSYQMNNMYIKPYYTVFGHFYLDHLFQLYKIQHYFQSQQHKQVNSILQIYIK
jgi:hypothetical protein